MSIYKELSRIQQELKAPKGQTNAFWKYKYRSCEDILEAVKPLLKETSLVISDDIVLVWDRFYVKATVTISDWKDSVSNTAFAREELTKKGMDGSQITGASSSYARKYALNGLFLIDDTKDSDATNDWSDKKQETIKQSKQYITSTIVDKLITSIKEWQTIAVSPEEAIKQASKKYSVSEASKKEITDKFNSRIF